VGSPDLDLADAKAIMGKCGALEAVFWQGMDPIETLTVKHFPDAIAHVPGQSIARLEIL